MSDVIQPITGTWVNLFDQDTRNRYTNPTGDGPLAATHWASTLSEWHDLGIRTLILLAVANEGAAMYPSTRFSAAYPLGTTSPVTAILDAADGLGLEVFLSCGWAHDQDDDQGAPEIRSAQRAIMDELAELYAARPSFCGWYLPCEDGFAPRPSDHQIDGVNSLVAHAKSVTPQALTLISPYLMGDAVVDDEYVTQLAKLTVDVIAYQDGVGCVLSRDVGQQWQRLRWAHDHVPRIALWANVETFSWEHGPANTRDDALVPASMARILHQLHAAGDHVERVVSFIVQGMVEAGDGPHQARGAHPLWLDYTDWRAGLGRWPLLARTFEATPLHHSGTDASIQLSHRPFPHVFNESALLDGKFGDHHMLGRRWVSLLDDPLVATIRLERECHLATVAVRFLIYHAMDIGEPLSIRVEVHRDGGWVLLSTEEPRSWPHSAVDCWADLALLKCDAQRVREIRVTVLPSRSWLFVDEIILLAADGDVGTAIESHS